LSAAKGPPARPRRKPAASALAAGRTGIDPRRSASEVVSHFEAQEVIVGQCRERVVVSDIAECLQLQRAFPAAADTPVGLDAKAAATIIGIDEKTRQDLARLDIVERQAAADEDIVIEDRGLLLGPAVVLS
jgi:hypothetical protein